MKRYVVNTFVVLLVVLVGASPAFAADGATGGYGPIAAAIAMGLAALGGTFGQAKAISAGLEAIGRNPSARGDIFTPMLVGLAFIESLVIISFVIAFLVRGA